MGRAQTRGTRTRGGQICPHHRRFSIATPCWLTSVARRTPCASATLDKAAASDRPLQMTDVTYAEVKCILLKKDGRAAWEQAQEVLKSLPVDFHSTSRALADTAADFKARFKISLADAFAAALAKERKAELVTGDPESKPLEKEIKINWLKDR